MRTSVRNGSLQRATHLPNFLLVCRRKLPSRPIAALSPIVANMSFDTFLPALGFAPEFAVFGSAVLATSSVVMNYFSGMQLEQKRAELALELERDKTFQSQLRELQGVIARYRGPLLESAIDLEHRIWHLVTDQCFDQHTADGVHEEVRYLLFTMAQFLGFVEVVRREGPRERPFLQAGNPQGSDTLSTLVEGLRFVLCASPAYLEEWYLEGTSRTHPGARRRRSREEVIMGHGKTEINGCEFHMEFSPALFRISRGHQRAIGTLMVMQHAYDIKRYGCIAIINSLSILLHTLFSCVCVCRSRRKWALKGIIPCHMEISMINLRHVQLSVNGLRRWRLMRLT